MRTLVGESQRLLEALYQHLSAQQELKLQLNQLNFASQTYLEQPQFQLAPPCTCFSEDEA